MEESRRREEAQAALIQAQRMEAFGQLTGGVAHDFNNLLTIVLGNLERSEPALAGKEERGQLQRAADAAQMGARLTARLLSFARRRPLAPSVLNINDLVLGIAEILKRSLGEQITLTTVLAGNLWPTKADASEVENAVLNLAINARDAMPAGGKLVIETRNVEVAAPGPAANAMGPSTAGDFVRISVSDTGTGMSPEVLQRAFEPFFTTKEGRGTGLGLSTIYGFASQSGGHVTIESEEGKGTTVNLFLPREREAGASAGAEAAPSVPLSRERRDGARGGGRSASARAEPPARRGAGLRSPRGGERGSSDRDPGEGAQSTCCSATSASGEGCRALSWAGGCKRTAPHTKVLLTTGYAADAAAGGEHARCVSHPAQALYAAAAGGRAARGARREALERGGPGPAKT